MKQQGIIVLIFSLSIVVFGCNFLKQPETKYGREYNEKRKEIGLPIIEDNWEIYTVHKSESTWVIPGRVALRDKNIPVHWSKYLNYRTGTLISERDTYFGAKDYYLEGEGTFREKLTIAYHYQKDDFIYGSKLGWNIRLYDETVPTGKKISLEEAEKILEKWGIERLNYEFSPED